MRCGRDCYAPSHGRCWGATEMRRIGFFLAMLIVFTGFGLAIADSSRAADDANPIPPGTTITLSNWQQYRQFMPDGLQGMLAGKFVWRFPAGFEIVVGPTSHYQAPQAFLDATQKYSNLVKIADLPDGGHTITGYVAGTPFPDPQEPMKGYKILVDNWYRYMPHLICGD